MAESTETAPFELNENGSHGRSLDQRLNAFISFPSPYTQSLIFSALSSTISSLSLTLDPPTAIDESSGKLALPHLQWADYDWMVLDDPRVYAHPPTDDASDREVGSSSGFRADRYMISSYIYRKTLIRKHMLLRAMQEYEAKLQVRAEKEEAIKEQEVAASSNIVPANGSISAKSLNLLRESFPNGWAIDIQFADELDELLMDELYDLDEVLRENEEKDSKSRRWYILKPGMSDKAQGIRMFSTVDELTAIVESFADEDSDEEEEGEEAEETSGAGSIQSAALSEEARKKIEALAIRDFPDDEPYEETHGSVGRSREEGSDDEDWLGTGVSMSQLRHFVIQEYVQRPMLFDPLESTRAGSPLKGHKFHLRAYVVLTGTYRLYLSRTMLALFSAKPFAMPSEDDDVAGAQEPDLTAHLTNTCLQASATDPSISIDDYVKLFWELQGSTLLADATSNSFDDLEYTKQGVITEAWLEETFQKVGGVIATSVQGAVECGSFGLQLLENAFEVFGVDLLLSFPEGAEAGSMALPIPKVSLLEYNASPDFTQSGDRLKRELEGLFKDISELVVKPFFGIRKGDEEEVGQANDDPCTAQNNLVLIAEKKSRGAW